MCNLKSHCYLNYQPWPGFRSLGAGGANWEGGTRRNLVGRGTEGTVSGMQSRRERQVTETGADGRS